MTEMWDLYDMNHRFNTPRRTGETVSSTDHLPNETYHLVVQLWIERDDGCYLIIKDHINSEDVWRPITINVLAGETAACAACRAAKPLLGEDLDPERGIRMGMFTTHRNGDNAIIEVWLFTVGREINIDDTSLKGQLFYKWASAVEIHELAAGKKWDAYDEFDYLDRLPFEDRSRQHEFGHIVRKVILPQLEPFDDSWNWYRLPENIMSYIRLWRYKFTLDLLNADSPASKRCDRGGITFSYYGDSYYLDCTVFGLVPDLASMMIQRKQEMIGMLQLIHVWHPVIECSYKGKTITVG